MSYLRRRIKVALLCVRNVSSGAPSAVDDATPIELRCKYRGEDSKQNNIAMLRFYFIFKKRRKRKRRSYLHGIFLCVVPILTLYFSVLHSKLAFDGLGQTVLRCETETQASLN